MDVSCVLHPLSVHKLDAGPIRLVMIAHDFNYRVVVLRDGVKSAIRVGRSRKEEGRFLMDTDLSWGQQVAVMFQIILTLTLEVPTFLKGIAGLRGMSPNVQLYSEPWGHVYHSDVNCACLSSDRTAAYVHDLALMPRERLLFRKWRTPHFIPGKAVRGCATLTVWVWDGRDGCHLCLISQALVVAYSWLFMCSGRRPCWCLLIGSAL